MHSQSARVPTVPTCGSREPTAAPLDETLKHGAFYLPTLLTGMDNAASIAQQEIFGPVLCVLPFDDEDDAMPPRF